MSAILQIQNMEHGVPDPRWKDLYKTGGISSLLISVLIIVAITVYFIWPYQPGFATVAEIFSTLQNDKLGGLMSLDFFMVVATIITIPLFLALYVALKQVNESFALIALVFGLISCTLILTVRPIAEMFYLSSQYAAATTDTARGQYLTAGETLTTLFNGTAWILYMLLFGISQLIFCLLMLRTTVFGRTTAVLGIILSIGMASVIPGIGVYINLLTTIIGTIWFILMARDFIRMGWGKPITTL